jgi:hypothetical protein
MAITWAKNAGQLAAMSAQNVQMLGEGQTLTGHRWNVWLNHANAFLKLLQTQGPSRWREELQTISLIAGDATYTLDPRPYRVDAVRIRDASGRDMPLTRWNRSDYRMIPYKNTPGQPTAYVVNQYVNEVSLVLWPVPNAYAATGSLIVDYDRVIEDVVDADSAIDAPQEWHGMLADILGVRLAGSFNLKNAAVEKAEERADAALIELLGSDHDDSITFTMED